MASPQSTESEKKSEPKNKRNSPLEPAPSGTDSEDNGEVLRDTFSSKMPNNQDPHAHDSNDSMNTGETPDNNDSMNTEETPNEGTSDHASNKVDNPIITETLPPNSGLGPAQWSEIMSRFDSFEKSIQATIKEEIKVSSIGVQNQVKKLNNTVKEVQNQVSSNQNAISKINKKVAQFDSFKDNIASEIEKQVSLQVAHLQSDLQVSKKEINELKKAKDEVSAEMPLRVDQLQNDLQASKTEINTLKKAQADAPAPQSNTHDHELRQEFIREQYLSRRRNLMLMGLEEAEEGEEVKSKIVTVLQTRLHIPPPKIEIAYRMGASRGKNPRPILITFATLPQRHTVWYKKGDINKDQTQKLWLQEDLPKPLRDDLSALLKIQKRAKSLSTKYPDVKIKDFKIRINGLFYDARNLHLIPEELKLANISTPQSDTATVFFRRSSPLSNHHLCQFVIAGKTFTCVEHFLAWQRANNAEDKPLAESVLEMEDPSEHKKVLNSLKETNQERWEESVENILKVALKAKFSQNPDLKKFLCDTNPRRIGEASLDTTWGIGLSLRNPDVLNIEKWNQEVNRLGKALESLRNELLQDHE